MPSHTHSATSSTQTATGRLGTGGNSEYFYKDQTSGVFSNGTSNGNGDGSSSGLKDRTGYLNFNYSHAHTVTVKATGTEKKHENRPPYNVVQRWRRTA